MPDTNFIRFSILWCVCVWGGVGEEASMSKFNFKKKKKKYPGKFQSSEV